MNANTWRAGSVSDRSSSVARRSPVAYAPGSPTCWIVLALVVCVVSQSDGAEPVVLREHTGWVSNVAFSNDGKYLFTFGSDHSLNVCDGQKPQVLGILEHSELDHVFAFSPTGSFFALGRSDGAVSLHGWSAKGRGRTLTGHRGPVMSLAFSGDGQRLVSGDMDGTIRSWTTSDAKSTAVIKAHRSWVNSLFFTSDGKLLASGSSDGTVKLWEAKSLQELSTFTLEIPSEVRSVAISPDSKLVAAGIRFGTARVWDRVSGKQVASLKAHESETWAVAFTPDGKTLVTGGGDWKQPGEVKLWDTTTWKEHATLKHSGEVLCVAVSPDGKKIAAGSWDGTVRVYTISPTE